MFNLIVAGGTRHNRQDVLAASRIFEYTEDWIRDEFRPNGNIDFTRLCRLPTLFMEEGIGDEVARLGWLSRVDLVGRELRFQYAFDPDVPPLTNAEIYELSAELQMADWEFSRNHWAIKNADLGYTLLKNRFDSVPAPTVFNLSESPVNPRLVSLMMPFGGFDGVHQALRKAIESAGFECRRADNFWQHSHIMQDIVELICTSQVVVCDLSGKNPNVFYEAGIAHTLGKEVILITQSMDDVPFDLRALRCITYLNNGEGQAKLATDVVQRITTVTGR
ncbi:hypothetical protein SLH49_13020 [Cognatiyoonia sp. IB215446]|uniref:hypothetical protein n=1 Tax=Cognatiyoonia sp. IB215446 TaxID=3097355 RepID=UPI002A0F2403|nr:hypothetical protein [Cognatiyoonia sp. IB215446]MDX8348901.1 hypothetical protein [Cognatiyoonia sp. IB215446]